jgi:plasmid maintenance system antidote protein VapI
MNQTEVAVQGHANNAQIASLANLMEYNPGNLLDALIERLSLKNDAALARALEVAPPLISKLRHKNLPVGGAILIRMHEVSGLSVRQLRMLMGDRRQKFRISDKQFKPKESSAPLLN